MFGARPIMAALRTLRAPMVSSASLTTASRHPIKPRCPHPSLKSLSGRASDLFKSQEIADAYAKYRPDYGDSVVDAILEFCKEDASFQFSLAVDVGCGSGQSTLALVPHFQKVIGLDVSQAQIARAPADVAHLQFLTGSAEDLSFLDGGSVDLMTVATALHWLDLERFYPQVLRVLRPGGVLGAYCYGLVRADNPAANEVIANFDKEVAALWGEGKKHVLKEYNTLALPFKGWRRCSDLKVEKVWTVEELVGFLSSWTSFHSHLASNPDSSLLSQTSSQLQAVYSNRTSGKRKVKVTFPIFLLLGRKPKTSSDS